MTDKTWNVAVVGALGMVGTEVIKTLEIRDIPVAELRPLDLAQFEGAPVRFAGRQVVTRSARGENSAGVDIAIFSAGRDHDLRSDRCGCARHPQRCARAAQGQAAGPGHAD